MFFGEGSKTKILAGGHHSNLAFFSNHLHPFGFYNRVHKINEPNYFKL